MRLRDPGIAWSYYSTDPEWGLMQAKSLITELEAALVAHEVSSRGGGWPRGIGGSNPCYRLSGMTVVVG